MLEGTRQTGVVFDDIADPPPPPRPAAVPPIRRRELASAAQLDVIILVLTSPRRAWVKAMYGRQDVRVWIVGDRLRPVPFDAYSAAELAEVYGWMLQRRSAEG